MAKFGKKTLFFAAIIFFLFWVFFMRFGSNKEGMDTKIHKGNSVKANFSSADSCPATDQNTCVSQGCNWTGNSCVAATAIPMPF